MQVRNGPAFFVCFLLVIITAKINLPLQVSRWDIQFGLYSQVETQTFYFPGQRQGCFPWTRDGGDHRDQNRYEKGYQVFHLTLHQTCLRVADAEM